MHLMDADDAVKPMKCISVIKLPLLGFEKLKFDKTMLQML